MTEFAPLAASFNGAAHPMAPSAVSSSTTMLRYQVAIDAFVAERADQFDVKLPTPWVAALSTGDYPRPLMDDLHAATVASRAVEALAANHSLSLLDAVDESCVSLPSAARSRHDRKRTLGRARALLLRAHMQSALLPDSTPSPLAERLNALQAHWAAKTAALEEFASALDAIAHVHGCGLSLSAADTRERQREVNAAAYAELRQYFIDHHSTGMSRLDLKDQEIQEVVLSSDPAAVALFTPLRTFSLLQSEFGAAAQDLARQQIADAFVDTFWLRGDTELRTVRGRVVIELRVWIDAFDKAHFGRVRYAYDSRARIEKALRSVADIWLQGRDATDAQQASDEFRTCLQCFVDADWTPAPGFRPNMLGIELRCFQGRIDVLVPEAFAAQINGFVTLHSKLLRDRLE